MKLPTHHASHGPPSPKGGMGSTQAEAVIKGAPFSRFVMAGLDPATQPDSEPCWVPGSSPGDDGLRDRGGKRTHIASNSRITSSTASTAPGLTRTLLTLAR